ncbi:hypothetical protein QFZ26_002682 [Agromyces ramosus]|uniref:Uncharacterized protein n=1 Tax=Agromyces ramosus TaxID=33879 RepID=A0ABU0RAL4_9MICO|nr:hypothetical protein [Agromyces ramosus]
MRSPWPSRVAHPATGPSRREHNAPRHCAHHRAAQCAALAEPRGPFRPALRARLHDLGAAGIGRPREVARDPRVRRQRDVRRRRAAREQHAGRLHVLRPVRRPRHHLRSAVEPHQAQRSRRAAELPLATTRPRQPLRARARRPALSLRPHAGAPRRVRGVPRDRHGRESVGPRARPAAQRRGRRHDRRSPQRREHHRLAAAAGIRPRAQQRAAEARGCPGRIVPRRAKPLPRGAAHHGVVLPVPHLERLHLARRRPRGVREGDPVR